MKITVLSDNIAPKDSGLKGEWGLSFFIEYEGKSILLDTGASSLFKRNAEKLSVGLEKTDIAVLSHAHYDHSDGMKEFFALNEKAPFYLSGQCKENCYGKRFIFSKYIGIRKGIMKKYDGRIIYVKDNTEISKGIHLIPHKTEGLEAIGKKTGLYVRKGGLKLYPDDFSHEQSLVFETEKGLVIFNSCSHAGADNILNEVSAAFPDKKIYGYIGGLHLYRLSKDDILESAMELKKRNLGLIMTGHCTGNKPYEILREVLSDTIEQLYVGKVTEI